MQAPKRSVVPPRNMVAQDPRKVLCKTRARYAQGMHNDTTSFLRAWKILGKVGAIGNRTLDAWLAQVLHNVLWLHTMH